jgi:hypothetical protein
MLFHRLAPVRTVSHTFTAAIIHLMDATSGDPTIQQQVNEKLRRCISALQEIETTWYWSFRARQAIQIHASTWLTRAPGSSLSTSGIRSRSKTSILIDSGAAQAPCYISPKLGPGAGTMLPESPAAFSEFERQFSNDSFPKLYTDDIGWIFNSNSTAAGVSEGPTDWQSLNEIDRWLAMAAQSTFTTTDMEP